ncbi:ATP-binding cassette domain-containing protein [Hymenobacter sp. 5516J-16]|uniref:ATP-binding cassette domain-containing protein n=1 Tax=Hymenobacter sp. 5516J-16 TaxID=2932253 RepID=UPI001FD58018|nr:ATP-binding cassette domain-containing protein [Hymenobacter sp. 5516J-16]UOQ75941.1 ATP-binding cassette domain-containing protein [Hymenobacter sp. 5516J-16]
MLLLQNLGYAHPNKDVLFDQLNLVVNHHQKMALVGNNGVGKSTLLQLLAGTVLPSGGLVHASSPPYYVPQHFGQFNDLTIAQALGIHDKIRALQEILEGQATEANLAVLDDDWTLEERSQEALQQWGLAALHLTQPMASLSGGRRPGFFWPA